MPTGREGDRAGGVGAGVADGGGRDQARVAGGGGDGERLDLVGRAGGDAGEVDGLEAGVLVDGDIGQRVKRRRLVDRVDGDREGAGDDVVAGAAVVDGDGDGGGAEAISDRGEGDRAGGVGAGVVTAGVGIRPGLLEEAVTVSVWTSLVAPEVMPERLTVCRLAFSLMVTLASALSVGGWLVA